MPSIPASAGMQDKQCCWIEGGHIWEQTLDNLGRDFRRFDIIMNPPPHSPGTVETKVSAAHNFSI